MINQDFTAGSAATGIYTFHMTEQLQYREEKNSSAELYLYVELTSNLSEVSDYDDMEDSMLTAALAQMPATWRGLVVDCIKLQERQADDMWTLRVQYKEDDKSSPSAKPSYDKAIENWDFSGTSQIVTQSRETVGRYIANKEDGAPSFNKLVGWNGNRVQGVSVEFASCRVSLRFLKKGDEVDMSYRQSIYELYNTVNASEFRSFAKGTLRFVGGTLQQREDGDFDITFNFVPDKTKTYEGLGTITATIEVPPHHYLWCTYKPTVMSYQNSDGATIEKDIQKAEFAYVEKIFEDGEFSLLEIPQ